MTATPLRRRTVLAAAGLGALTMTAAGCGGEQAGSRHTLELWLPGPQGDVDIQHELEFYQALLEPFIAEHGVQIALPLTPWESDEENCLTGVSRGVKG